MSARELSLGNDILPDDPAVHELFSKLFGLVPKLLNVANSSPPPNGCCATAFDYVQHPQPLTADRNNNSEIVARSLSVFISRNMVNPSEGLALSFGHNNTLDASLLLSIAQSAGLLPSILQTSSGALSNFLSFTPDKLGIDTTNDGAKFVYALDIGEHSTTVIITNGRTQSQRRSIDIGGRTFTEAIMKGLNLSYAKADHLKRNCTRASNPTLVLQLMRPIFNDFAREVKGNLDHREQREQIAAVLLLGGGANLIGLKKFLNQNLPFPVLHANEIPLCSDEHWGFDNASFITHDAELGVALGLALHGINMGSEKTNMILDSEVSKQPVSANYAWGIDIGTYALKAVRLTCERPGSETLRSLGSRTEKNLAIVNEMMSDLEHGFYTSGEELETLLDAYQICRSFSEICDESTPDQAEHLQAMRGTIALSAPMIKHGLGKFGRQLLEFAE